MTRHLETDTLSNQNISSALEIGSYTADADRLICCQLFVDQVAGNDDYVFYATLQINGAGSAYRFIPITTAAAASGLTAIGAQAILIPVRSGDIVKVYVTGAAGDTTTPDTTVRWFELAALRPTTADRTLDVSAGGEAGVDWANIGSPTTVQGLSGTTVKAVTDEVDIGEVKGAAVTGVADFKADVSAVAVEANVEGHVTTALGAYDGPTKAEMDTAHGLLATPAQVATELATYDGPTKGEMDTAHALLATEAKQDIIDTNVDAILADTGTAGVVVASHTTAAKAELQAEANDALIALKLDHLVAVAENDDPVDDSIIAKLAASDGDWSGFDEATDSLEAIRDVWRTSGAAIVDVFDGSAVTKKRGDAWSVAFTGDNAIGDITGFSKLWLTVKQREQDADSEAVFQVLLSSPDDDDDGLQYLNGAEGFNLRVSTVSAVEVSAAALRARMPHDVLFHQSPPLSPSSARRVRRLAASIQAIPRQHRCRHRSSHPIYAPPVPRPPRPSGQETPQRLAPKSRQFVGRRPAL